MKAKSSSQKDVNDKKTLHCQSHSRNKRSEAHSSGNLRRKPSKPEEPMKINFSQDKLEHMKKLAHELSLRLASKVGSNIKGNVQEMQESQETVPELEKPCTKTDTEDAGCLVEVKTCDAEDHDKKSLERSVEASVEISVSSSSAAGIQLEQGNIKSESDHQSLDSNNILEEFSDSKGIYDSDEDLEDMRQLAHELKKELSHKVQVAATINRPKLASKNETESYSQSGSETSLGKASSPRFEDTRKLVGTCYLESDGKSLGSTSTLGGLEKPPNQLESERFPPTVQTICSGASPSLCQSLTSLNEFSSSRPEGRYCHFCCHLFYYVYWCICYVMRCWVYNVLFQSKITKTEKARNHRISIIFKAQEE